jgi:hypothetical protein
MGVLLTACNFYKHLNDQLSGVSVEPVSFCTRCNIDRPEPAVASIIDDFL